MNIREKIKQILKKDYLYEIGSYEEISKEKIDLYKSVAGYLDSLSFNDIKDRYNKNVYSTDEKGYVQTVSRDGDNILVPINIFKKSSSQYNTVNKKLRQEKFDKLYNKYYKAGSQRYTHLDINRKNDSINEVYFTEDGNVFMNQETAEYIANNDTNELASFLAYKCQLERKDAIRRKEISKKLKLRRE